MEDINETWLVLAPPADNVQAARALGPVSEKNLLGRTSFIFDNQPRSELEKLGDVSRINLSDLFVTLMDGEWYVKKTLPD